MPGFSLMRPNPLARRRFGVCRGVWRCCWPWEFGAWVLVLVEGDEPLLGLISASAGAE